MLVTYVPLHLCGEFLASICLLSSTVHLLHGQVSLVVVDFLVEVTHHRLIEVLRSANMRLVAIQSLPPGDILGGIIVLDYSAVFLRNDITAIIKRLDLVSPRRCVSCQSILTQVDVAFQFRGEN